MTNEKYEKLQHDLETCRVQSRAKHAADLARIDDEAVAAVKEIKEPLPSAVRPQAAEHFAGWFRAHPEPERLAARLLHGPGALTGAWRDAVFDGYKRAACDRRAEAAAFAPTPPPPLPQKEFERRKRVIERFWERESAEEAASAAFAKSDPLARPMHERLLRHDGLIEF